MMQQKQQKVMYVTEGMGGKEEAGCWPVTVHTGGQKT